MSAGKRGFWIGLVLVVLAGVFVAASLQRSDRRGAKEVKVQALERAPIEAWVRAPGKVEPVRTVQISSNVQGRVAVLEVEEGDRVRTGQLLLRLDDERYRSQATQMRSRLDAAVANLRVAEAQNARAQQDLERKERLYQQKLISPEALEEAATTARVEGARVEAAREEVGSTRAQLEQAEADLEETVFEAPISGIVTALFVEQGENVVTGTMNNPGTIILTLAELDTMQVRAEVDETDVVRLARGQEARVEVDALPGRSLDGTVTSVGQSGRSSGSGGEGTSFLVEVRLLDAPAELRPGMSADVEVLTGRRDSALVVPIQALGAHPESKVRAWEAAARGTGATGSNGEREPGEETGGDAASRTAAASASRLPVGAGETLVEGVFSVRDGRARFHRIELGLRSETHFEVLSSEPPLSSGDRIVTGPYRTLRELEAGDRLRPEGEEGSPRAAR